MRRFVIIAVLGIFVPGVSDAFGQSVVATQQAKSTITDQQTAANARINLDLTNASLSEAIRYIEERGGIRIGYTKERLPATVRITMHESNLTVAEALRKVLSGTGLAVSAYEGQLAITSREGVAKRLALGIITGKVTDSKTGRGVSDATVSIENDTRGIATDADGKYRLVGVTSGTHVVIVRLVGYSKETRTVTVGEGETVVVDFKVEPSASILDQVVVTGTVVASELRSVPSAITVVTAKQIEDRGITRIDQLFRGDIPGLFSVNSGASNPIDSVTMFSRGASSAPSNFLERASTNAIKTYVDGVELASSAYLNQIDPRSIERIEILTGPQASTIYGSNAINGVMQIFTKRGSTTEPQIRAVLLSGLVQNNFSSALTPQHDLSAQISGIEGRTAYNFGGSWVYIGPWTPAKQTTTTNGFGGLRFSYKSLTSDLSYRQGITTNRSSGLSTQGVLANETHGLYVFQGYGGHAPPLAAALNGQTVGLSLNYTLFQRWSHQFTYGTDRSDSESRQLNPGNIYFADTLLTMSQWGTARTSIQYNSTAQVPLGNLGNLVATVGADGWQSLSTQLYASGSNTLTGNLPGSKSITRQPSHNTGAFFQGQFGMFESLFVTYGLRAEWNPNYGDEAQPNLAPRYGAAYTREIGPLTAKLRASYGRSTRPPATNQKNSIAAGDFLLGLYGPHDAQFANPDLSPEFQQGGEGGVELYFGSRGSLVVTRYNQTVDGLILNISIDSIRSLVPDPFGFCSFIPDFCGRYMYNPITQNINVGSIRNQGWELQSSVNFGPVRAHGVYSFNKSRFLGVTPAYRERFGTSGQYAPGSSFRFNPEHTWAAQLSYARASTSVSLNFNGTGLLYRAEDAYSTMQGGGYRLRITQPRVSFAPGFYAARGAGYVIADMNANHRINPRVEGVLYIQNLSNLYRNDADIRSATMGRQIKAGLRVGY